MNRFAVTLDSVVIVSRQNQISDGDPKKRVCLKFVFVKNNNDILTNAKLSAIILNNLIS